MSDILNDLDFEPETNPEHYVRVSDLKPGDKISLKGSPIFDVCPCDPCNRAKALAEQGEVFTVDEVCSVDQDPMIQLLRMLNPDFEVPEVIRGVAKSDAVTLLTSEWGGEVDGNARVLVVSDREA